MQLGKTLVTYLALLISGLAFGQTGTISVKKPNTIPAMLMGEWQLSKYITQDIDTYVMRKSQRGKLLKTRIGFTTDATYYETNARMDTIYGQFRVMKEKRLVVTDRKSEMALYNNTEFMINKLTPDSLVLGMGNISDLQMVFVRRTTKVQ